MEARLLPTQALLKRSKELRYPIRKPTLLKLVQAGFVDHAKRPGKGQGKGRAGLWTRASLRQISAWCRFRKAGLRDERLAFAMWWETGMLTPGVRDFLRYILRSVSVMIADVVYGEHRPQSNSEAKAMVRRYVARTEPDVIPIVEMFGEYGADTEFRVLAGALELFTPNEPLSATVQKLAPLWAELSSPPPPQSIDSMMETIRPHLKTFAVVAYSLAPHFALSKIHAAIDGATDEELSSARIYFRQAAAATFLVRGTRPYYRRLRKVLAAVSRVFRGGVYRRRRVPRWARPFQDAYTREGLLAFAIFVLLRVQQAVRKIRADSSSEFPTKEPAGVRNESDQKQ